MRSDCYVLISSKSVRKILRSHHYSTSKKQKLTYLSEAAFSSLPLLLISRGKRPTIVTAERLVELKFANALNYVDFLQFFQIFFIFFIFSSKYCSVLHDFSLWIHFFRHIALHILFSMHWDCYVLISSKYVREKFEILSFFELKKINSYMPKRSRLF